MPSAMQTLDERKFHLLMGAVFLSAVILEEFLGSQATLWNPPRIGFVTFIVGMVWVGRYCGWRSELDAEQRRVLDDRLARQERRIDALEDELRAARRDPLGRG